MRTVDISGMDPERKQFGYEWGCQVILCRALSWLRERPEGAEWPRIRYFKNITGLTQPANKAAKELETFALDHAKVREFGATGAMVQFAIGHAMKRAELGDEAYFKELGPHRQPQDFFEFDDTEAFPERQPA